MRFQFRGSPGAVDPQLLLFLSERREPSADLRILWPGLPDFCYDCPAIRSSVGGGGPRKRFIIRERGGAEIVREAGRCAVVVGGRGSSTSRHRLRHRHRPGPGSGPTGYGFL
ncbi:hypothetical protein MPTK1_3g23570 [Marchantia polymorpha subsp. ruderalis]|uniref:Uncharacterized protein n=2 Tax=Marchantia polymorpha TaxID=3197 RepID=A0AAF6B412_MARPO|nr:hypothetical protein MARPO_0024s0133 [Marchantia polymorpha]BBN06746.1 hypothetical protein Mp_3g23570 [Marchantia polymorpha subsp. ruderalis]|eukprot:PTQ43645.1 hypothetical protein MARPO_0024s0133 [Marchantia polymorpha]